jgi:hypothetical protein
VWAWVADHDLDISAQTQLDIYNARGILIESQGPSWFYGTASEHSVLYQYQLVNARNIFLGHIQTETPYFQGNPPAPEPINIGTLPSDPTFADCKAGDAQCTAAWALRILESSDIFIYGAGLYSFFQQYDQNCLFNIPENCQNRLVETNFSSSIWLYSLYTKGASECVSPLGPLPAVSMLDNINGYLTAVSAWLGLAVGGGNLGGDSLPDNSTATGSSPNNASPVPLTCTSGLQCGQTLTLTPACATEIAQLPNSGMNNNPPVQNCYGGCDLMRLLSGTCCGEGGSLCVGIDIPPNVTLPAEITLTSGYTI